MHQASQQIYWYSGLYLQPQHLQAMDLYHGVMLSRQRQLTQPWNLGLIECEYNPDTLADFSLNIEKLKAIFPSGDYIEYPGNCTLAPRYFRNDWAQSKKSFRLWLALRRFDPNHANVGESPNSRWCMPLHDTVMKDVYATGPECNVARILYNVQILSDDEKALAMDCEFLLLTQVCYDNEKVVVDPCFIPPLLNISAVAAMRNMLEGLHAELSSRVRQLEEYKYPGETINGDNNISQLIVLQSLNRNLALLHHYITTPGLHPWIVYGLLIQLSSELSTFTPHSLTENNHGRKLIIQPYDHFKLGNCFMDARNCLISLINNMSLREKTWAVLMRDKHNVFRSPIPDLPVNASIVALLSLRSESLTTPIDSNAFKLACSEDINTLLLHALPGVEASWLNPVPRGLPRYPDRQYFQLDQQSELWKNAIKNKNIAFYWHEAPEDTDVHIIFWEAG